MVDIYALNRGDRVRIVDHWGTGCGENSQGYMDKWLGQVMTVRKVYNSYVKMEEDCDDRYMDDGWAWFPNAIQCVLSESDVDTEDIYFSPDEFNAAMSKMLGITNDGGSEQ